ncbi:MAG TPA: prolipoprotein diacylglyceryl transferase family protein [Actinomycetota bacterium]|nr:prolipoprotein diacylglyceryl transferase family protein [Actinomycetota bacterium]
MELLSVIGWPVIDRIRLGPVAISPHGIGIAAGYLAGAWWMLRHGRRRGLSDDNMGTILFAALVGAIVGARFFYVVGHADEFESFVEVFQIWRGGISLVGGIVGAIAFAYPYMRKFRYRFLQVMDSAAIGLAFGIVVGRIGDLLIGDHLGKPTDFFLGWAYRGGTLPGPWVELPDAPGTWVACLADGSTQYLSRAGASLLPGEACPPIAALPQQMAAAGVHQTALYDFFIAIGLFLFLLWMGRVARREGVLILTFAIWYGAGRVLTDFLRVDKTWFGLTGSQWTSLGAIVISLIVLVRFARRPIVPPEGDEIDPETRAAAAEPVESVSRPTTEFTPPREPGAG